MGGFTVVNLKDVEDSATRFGYAPDLEARFARQALEGEQVGVSYQRLAPNARVPFGHRHAEQEEVYVIVGGAGRLKLDDDVTEVRRWDAIRVAPEVTRCFEAGPEGLELIAFGASPTQDADVLPGWWADET